MAFSSTLPVWLATGSKPSDDFINNGFKPNDGPPPEWFNYQWNRTYLAIQELQQKAGEIKTINGQQPDSNGNITIETGGGTAATVSIVDAGNYYTSTNVEGALQEIGQTMNSVRGSLIQSAQALLGM